MISTTMDRPICPVCSRRPCAINYKKGDKRYYRKKCDTCSRTGKNIKPAKPRWLIKGYTKKRVCDACGFRSKYSSQLVVVHTDGNLNNNELTNLKSICLNCAEAARKQDLPWLSGDLEQDS